MMSSTQYDHSDAMGAAGGSSSSGSGGFSLMNSLKGGASGGGNGGGDADPTARLREGLSPRGKNKAATQQQPSHQHHQHAQAASARSPSSSGTAAALRHPQPLARAPNSFSSPLSYQQQQQQQLKQHQQQQRRPANYRSAPKKGFSPKSKGSHPRPGSSEGGGRWTFPGLSPQNSADSEDQQSSRGGSVHTTATGVAGHVSTKLDQGGGAYGLQTSSFDGCYSPATPGFHDAFTLLEGSGSQSPQKLLPSSPERTAAPNQLSSPRRDHLRQPQAAPLTPSSRGSGGSNNSFKPQLSESAFPQTTINGGRGGTDQNDGANPSPSHLQPHLNSPPRRMQQSMPAPPSGSKGRPSPTKLARSASPLNFPLVGKAKHSPAVDARAASPLLGSSRVRKSIAWGKAKIAGAHHSRSRSKGSGNYSDAVSQALEGDDVGKDVDIIDKLKSSNSGGTAKSQEGIEVVSAAPGVLRSPRKMPPGGRLRTRSPSPVKHLGGVAASKSSGNNGNGIIRNNNDDNDPSLVHMDRDSTASTPSFFGLRGVSPLRMKRNLTKRLNIPIPSSPGRQRPPMAQQSSQKSPGLSPEKNPLPLHPSSESGTLSGKGEGSVEEDDDEDIDLMITSLAHTTMSFDVDDEARRSISVNSAVDEVMESAPQLPPQPPPPQRQRQKQLPPTPKAIPENDIENDEGYFINTTSFNVFESHKFLRAMGGNASEASLATNYIRTGDSLCGEGVEQFERAVQVFYAGLGVILARVRDWSLERRGESHIPLAAVEAADETPIHLLYDDFLEVARSPETNVLLLAMSSVLLRAGNTHYRLRKYELACHNYISAQKYRSMRHEAKDIIAAEKKDYSNLHVEDVKLDGRISNNMASAQSRRGMYDEARSEYTKALQIKQGTLEALHKNSSNLGGVKEVDDKNLVADIASTFHNIGLLRMECGEPKKAEKAYKQSLSLQVKKFGLDDLGVSSTLSALGHVYYHQKQYDDAFRSYKESLRIWKMHSKKSDLKTAEHYYNIGLIFYSTGPFAKSKTSMSECLRIRRQICGNNSLLVASALYLMGLITLSSGNYDEASSLLEESLGIRQKLLESNNHFLLLNVQLALGKVHQRRSDLDSAMDCFSAALTGRTHRLGQDHVAVSEVLHEIGTTYIAANEYLKAHETLEEALRIRKLSPGQSLEVAETLNSLSLVHFKSGDTQKAIELGEQALDVLKSAACLDHLLVGKTLKNMGDYYQEMEAYGDAMTAYGESLEVMTAWYGQGHMFLSEILNEIGVAGFKNGEYMIAKQSFMEALRLMRLTQNEANKSAMFPTLNHLGHALYKNNELKLAAETYTESFNIQVSIVTGDANDGLKEFGTRLTTIKDRIAAMVREEEDVTEISNSLGGIASILRYLGLVIQGQGDFEAALSTNKLSLSVRLCQPIKEHSAIALMAETIAMFEYKRNNLESAMDYFNQALDAKKSYQGDSTIDVARTVNNLANIHFSLGNLDDAMELYQEALEIKRHCLGDDSDEVANTLNNIAHVMVNAGKEQEALKAYHNVVRIRQDRYGKSHVSVAATLASMGDVYIKLGKLEIAMTYFEQCIRIQKLRQDNCDVRVLENLGSIYGKLGEWHKAGSTFTEIIEMKRDAHGDECVDVAKTLDLLAVSYIEQDRYADSIEHLQEALRIRKACLDMDDDEILASLHKLAFVYKSLDMTEQMLEVRHEFDTIQHRRRDSSSP